MGYSYCGNSGIQLTEISLGLCYNFGFADDYETACEMIIRAFEQEITHLENISFSRQELEQVDSILDGVTL